MQEVMVVFVIDSDTPDAAKQLLAHIDRHIPGDETFCVPRRHGGDDSSHYLDHWYSPTHPVDPDLSLEEQNKILTNWARTLTVQVRTNILGLADRWLETAGR